MKCRNRRIGLLATVGLLLVVTGCAPRVPDMPIPPAQPSLTDTSWILEEYGEPESLSPVIPDTQVTLSFDGTEEVTGFTGCNSYGGTYTSEPDGTLVFGEMHQTTILCEEPGVMDQEEAFMEALRLAEEYEVVDGYLYISGAGGLLVFSQT